MLLTKHNKETVATIHMSIKSTLNRTRKTNIQGKSIKVLKRNCLNYDLKKNPLSCIFHIRWYMLEKKIPLDANDKDITKIL